MWQIQDYSISIDLFFRLLGFIYFVVYFPFIFQIKGLLGSKGILPVDIYLKSIKARLGKRAYRLVPTIFWINSSNTALLGSVYLGLLFSVLLMLNIATPLMLLLLYILHISIVTAGQDFLSFGWEMFLLEITVNAFFLSLAPNPLIWISLNILLFRFHFQGGAVKLQSHDVNWRNLTGVAYHYESQPIPNMISWYVHKLPMWFQKISTAFMFFVELIVPFLMLGTDEMRVFVWTCFIGLQLAIWFTGNFSYLNYLTIAFSTILLSNTYLSPIISGPNELVTAPFYLTIPISIVGGFLILFQIMNVWNYLIFPINFFRRIQYKLAPYHIINRYGIFAVMTTKRYEIVIEGSDDGKTWKEYLFYYKPSEIERRPRWFSPYQPRLDWQAWFLPFTDYQDEPWFQHFLLKLLQGEPDVTKLLRYNPFSDKPPKYIRAVAYDYVYSDYQTKQKTGQWWVRTYVGDYSPTLYLKQS